MHAPCIAQVGFHDQKRVRYMTVPKRLNEIVNRLNKTKQARCPASAAVRCILVAVMREGVCSTAWL